jgi:hypothetical protein
MRGVKLASSQRGRRPLPGKRWSLRFVDLAEVAGIGANRSNRAKGRAALRPLLTIYACFVSRS